jgi:AraC-like DNA-binding protein
MTKNTLNYAETTEIDSSKCVLSDVLKSMRIAGSLLIHEDYVPPWKVAIPNANNLRSLLKLGTDSQVVAFHFVKRGFIEVSPEGGESIIVEAGEMAICFSGKAHFLFQNSDAKAISVESILIEGNNPFAPTEKNIGRSTSVMCGVFMMQNLELNPLLNALPNILHVKASNSASYLNLSKILSWISKESIQCAFVIERLLELLCAEVMRTQLDTSTTSSSWFSAVKDPVVGKALSIIHSQPGDSWSVDRLANSVAMSPSRFAARFTAELGDSPMSYVTKWRMNLASRLLEDSQQKIESIASTVGYENVAAFSRTFKRHLGVPPAAWRSR